MTTGRSPAFAQRETLHRARRLVTLAGWFLAVNTLIVLSTLAAGLGEGAAMGASRGARAFIAWCGLG